MQRAWIVGCALLCLVCLTAVWAADPPKYRITFTTQTQNLRMKPEALASLKARIEALFPEAVEQVVAFFGSEEPRNIFASIKIAVYDADPVRTGLMGRSGYGRYRMSGEQGIRIYSQHFLTEVNDLHRLLVHELIHATIQSRRDFDEYREWPGYLSEGLAYFGANQVEPRITARLNNQPPILDWSDLKGRKWEAWEYLREVSFVYCVGRSYGESARAKLITMLYQGKPWQAALEKAAPEKAAGEKLDAIKKKCDACLEQMVDERFKTGGPLWGIVSANDDGNYQSAIEQARKFLQDPASAHWKPATVWQLARAFEENKQYDEALGQYEAIRQGKVGYCVIDGNAAQAIVRTLAKKGDCAAARAKRQEFADLYPEFWSEWRTELDEMFKKHCEKSETAK